MSLYWALKRRNSRYLDKRKQHANVSRKLRMRQSVVPRRVEWRCFWTSPRRCRRQGRSSWQWVNCYEWRAGMSCQKVGSCTSHRSVTRYTWPYSWDDDRLGKCFPRGWSSCIQLCASKSRLQNIVPRNLTYCYVLRAFNVIQRTFMWTFCNTL